MCGTVVGAGKYMCLWNVWLFVNLYFLFACVTKCSNGRPGDSWRNGHLFVSAWSLFFNMRGFTEKILFLNIHNYSNDIAIDITHSTKILIRSLAIFFSNSNWHCIHTRMTRKKMLHRREKYGCIRRAYTDLYSPQCKERQGQLRNAVSEVICIWNSVCIRALRKTLPGVFPPNKSAGSDAVKLNPKGDVCRRHKV